MTGQEAVENLFKTIYMSEDAMSWLNRSYRICEKIGIRDEYSDEEFDAFETLTSRYARVSDILIHKVFRAMDTVEMEYGGTIIDVVNRAHKRNLFESVDEIREIKDIRNEIAHEYIQNDLCGIFNDVLRLTPKVSELLENIKRYCEKYE
ncbi:MAG: hypothetical protein DRI57_28580 [Deltaproteobacteria bacterium]|nr:MAG: hypothetical protein DRI57_28580 [Deltaproteobacteria bacterium]